MLQQFEGARFFMDYTFYYLLRLFVILMSSINKFKLNVKLHSNRTNNSNTYAHVFYFNIANVFFLIVISYFLFTQQNIFVTSRT